MFVLVLSVSLLFTLPAWSPPTAAPMGAETNVANLRKLMSFDSNNSGMADLMMMDSASAWDTDLNFHAPCSINVTVC